MAIEANQLQTQHLYGFLLNKENTTHIYFRNMLPNNVSTYLCK